MQGEPTKKGIRFYIILSSFAFLLTAGIGFMVYSSICPCEGTPGGFLLGERESQSIDDWSFVNEVPNCQIQIWAGIRPHSLNLNCFSTPEGALFVSCGNCPTKYWGTQVGPDERGLIRIADRLFPVTFNRVTDPSLMDNVWEASKNKRRALAVGEVEDVPRAPTWAIFSLTSDV